MKIWPQIVSWNGNSSEFEEEKHNNGDIWAQAHISSYKDFFFKAEKPFLTNSYFLGLPHMENDNMIFYWRFLPTLYIKNEKFGAT